MTEINRTSLAFKPGETAGAAAAGSGIIDLPLDVSVLGMPEAHADARGEERCSVSDALVKSVRDTGRVDLNRIAESAGVTVRDAIEALRGSIYRNPDTWGGKTDQGWETADEYLSGNLRYKLIKARLAYKFYKGTFKDNVRALEALLPAEMSTEDIYVTLGSPWLPEEVIEDFVNYLIQPHEHHSCSGIKHDVETGSWEIPNKGIYHSYVRNYNTFGTKRMEAVTIVERTLNMKTIRITDEVSSKTTKSGKKRVLNKEETAAAQEKQKLITDEFRRWIWKDEARARKVRKIFEDRYACMRARRFDGRFLEFPGMSEAVSLYPYQKDAVARILFTPNTLLAHDVGAGKTYIMIAAAMELRRLGSARRCMFVVPNNLVEQWRSIFIELYPQAKLLCIEPRDMDPDHRNRTLRQVIDGDHDGIIIACSCFDRIPLSRRSHIDALKAERAELQSKVARKKNKATSALWRKLGKVDKELSEMALADDPAASMICFDDLGIDRLFVDEAHNYKNVSIDSSIYGVYGISSSGSSKCDSMMDKVHYVQKTQGGGGVIMATGTPITNSISDIFVFQKYLQSGELKLLDLQTFDNWVGMFAEKTTEFEIAVDTGSFRLATRFSRFHNIPELTTILSSIADFHSMDADGDLPEFEGYTDVLVPCSTELKEYLKEISGRADKVHERLVKPEDDNMLKITSDGRKAALDIRLVMKEDGGEPVYGGLKGRLKVSECAERTAKIWHATKEDKLTQLVFCDTSTPRAGFNMYDELRTRLIDLGVDGAEIAFIHSANTERRREKLFADMREGRIRVLIGSTFKLGLGVNVQDRLYAVHHLDLPWRPADMVQREGRILRTGNLNPKVQIFRYITEGSFDAYSWQLLETKQRFITDILSGTIAGRSGSEVDDTVLDYAEVKALALGDPLLKSRVETRNEISRLAILRKKSIEGRLRLEHRYRALPDEIAEKELELRTCESDAAFISGQGKDLYLGRSVDDKKRISEWRRFLREQLTRRLQLNAMRKSESRLFDYRGFMIVLPAGMEADYPYVYLVREGRYRVDLSDKEMGVLVRIDNYLDRMDERVNRLSRELDILRQELRETETSLAAADSYADMIDECEARLDEIDKELGISKIKA